jgi:hypothetical protein
MPWLKYAWSNFDILSVVGSILLFVFLRRRREGFAVKYWPGSTKRAVYGGK